jgi:mRNA-degrading endonuclease toxin of MazEF toxin-antitoxin module
MVGDVVLAPLLSTDLSGSEIRHAVVLSDVGMEDWILCEITTCREIATSRQMGDGYIPIAEHDLEYGELRHRSWAHTNRIYTVNERVFRRTIGRLSAAKHAEVSAAVRSLF